MRKIVERVSRYSWLGIIIIFAACFIKARVPDSDTFFIAATGRHIVENGVVPTINPFVIHDGLGIVVQQWLFDVLIYGIYNTFGNFGLFVYVASIYAAGLFLLYRFFGLFTSNPKIKRMILIASSVLLAVFGVARPTGISFVILLSLLYCIEQYRRTQNKKYLCVLPILSLLEINIHAAMWPMMFVLILPYIFPYTLPTKTNIGNNIKKWFGKNKFILITMLTMFGMGFINPNGLTGMTYLLHSYGSATGGITIQELLPPATNELSGIVIILSAVFVAAYIYLNKNKLTDPSYDKQNEFSKIYLALGTLVLACMHGRNMWYLLLGITPEIVSVLDGRVFNKQKTKKTSPTYMIYFRAIYSVVATVVITITVFSVTDYAQYTNEDSNVAPIKAVEYLNENADDNIILYTEFNNGAFFEWHQYKVYMDARPELFQKKVNGKKNVYTEYCNVEKGKADYQEFLDKYGFTHLMVSENTRFDVYLRHNENYNAAVTGNGYTLYELKK